jgi:hypothetical protein
MDNEFLNMLERSKKVIAIDFDGVIHDDYKGFHDGTIYGMPIDLTGDALKKLSQHYTLVIYSCKSNPYRPKIDNKDGTYLIWEWLKKWHLDTYISDVVWGKPNAIAYIDDKGIKFISWTQTLKELKLL